jgi:hypothetical protein
MLGVNLALTHKLYGTNLYHLSIEIATIKRSFFLSVLLEKETVTKAMLYFYNSSKEKNHYFLYSDFN